jgi:hypothetical protein
VVWLKGAFRQGGQVFINEALSRQRVFNGHVRDSYAQLSAEVLRLRQEVEALKAQVASKTPENTGISKNSRPASRKRR